LINTAAARNALLPRSLFHDNVPSYAIGDTGFTDKLRHIIPSAVHRDAHNVSSTNVTGLKLIIRDPRSSRISSDVD